MELVTQYPGIRRLLICCEHVQAKGTSYDDISTLWDVSSDKNQEDPEWVYYCQLAAFCVSDNTVALSVETANPTKLAVALDDEGGIIGQLLRLLNAEINRFCNLDADNLRTHSKLLSHIAVRYLAGIIECPTFWDRQNYTRHKGLGMQLLKTASILLGDIGLDASHTGTTASVPLWEAEGIDILSDALLNGVRRWAQDKVAAVWRLECWVDHFGTFAELLQWYVPPCSSLRYIGADSRLNSSPFVKPKRDEASSAFWSSSARGI